MYTIRLSLDKTFIVVCYHIKIGVKKYKKSEYISIHY